MSQPAKTSKGNPFTSGLQPKGSKQRGRSASPQNSGLAEKKAAKIQQQQQVYQQVFGQQQAQVPMYN